jgi:DNA polymerase-3 subunit epsilon
MLLLGIDLETTGLDINTCQIIEIGLVLWHVDIDTHSPKIVESFFVKGAESLSDEIVALTGISLDDLEDFGSCPKYVFHRVQSLIKTCNYVVAHNGNNFDKPILKRVMDSLGLEWIDRLWLDTSEDIDFSDKVKTKKLTYLAAEHGFLNPFAHRAVFDVLTMFRVLEKYNLSRIIDNAKSERVELCAEVEKPWIDSGASSSLAKSMGFYWDGSKKLWIKKVRKNQLEELLKSSKLKLKILSPT